METTEQDYFLMDVTRDAWRVCKQIAGPVLMNMLLFILLTGGLEWLKLNQESKLTLSAAGLTKNICGLALSMWLIIKTYDVLRGDDEESPNVIEEIKSKIIPYFLSDLIVSIIVGFIIAVIGVFTIGISLALHSGMGTLISSLVILGVSIYYAIKYAFVGQAVVIGDVKYMDALNQSDSFSKGYGGTIIGIAIFPVLIAFVPTYVIPLLGNFSEITLSFGLAIIAAFVHVYSALAMTVLYMYIRKEKDTKGIEEYVEPLASIEE